MKNHWKEHVEHESICIAMDIRGKVYFCFDCDVIYHVKGEELSQYLEKRGDFLMKRKEIWK